MPRTSRIAMDRGSTRVNSRLQTIRRCISVAFQQARQSEIEVPVKKEIPPAVRSREHLYRSPRGFEPRQEGSSLHKYNLAGCGAPWGKGGGSVGTIDTPPIQNGRSEEKPLLDRPVKKETSYREEVVGRDWALMFRWFNEHGFDVDFLMTRNRFEMYGVPLTSFRKYVGQTRLGIEEAA
jgi:hypothetical protein